jgi:hypothetical protein
MKRANVTWRVASRDEPIGLVLGEYSKKRSWGGYYGDGGGRRYENCDRGHSLRETPPRIVTAWPFLIFSLSMLFA